MNITVLPQATAIPALPAPTPATPAEPRTSVTAMYAKFEQAFADMQNSPTRGSADRADEAEFDRLADKVFAIGAVIVSTPARSLSDMLLKIRVAAWCTGTARCERLEEVDTWRPGTLADNEVHHCLASLRDDLQAFMRDMKANGLIPVKTSPFADDATDDRLRVLGDELDRAVAEEVRVNDLWDQTKPDDGDPLARSAEEAHQRCSGIVRQIEQLHARTLDGLRVKARAVSWCHSGDRPIELVNNPATDVRLAQGIIADLLADDTDTLAAADVSVPEAPADFSSMTNEQKLSETFRIAREGIESLRGKR